MGYERKMDYVYLDGITVRTGILSSKFWKLMERVNAVQLKKYVYLFKICFQVVKQRLFHRFVTTVKD